MESLLGLTQELLTKPTNIKVNWFIYLVLDENWIISSSQNVLSNHYVFFFFSVSDRVRKLRVFDHSIVATMCGNMIVIGEVWDAIEREVSRRCCKYLDYIYINQLFIFNIYTGFILLDTYVQVKENNKKNVKTTADMALECVSDFIKSTVLTKRFSLFIVGMQNEVPKYYIHALNL